MLNITVVAKSAASPERVLALAGTDFSARRAKVWGNVKESRLAVHERGATHVEVTEYGTGPAWFAWERSRYDWSQPGSVTATVTDSNVYAVPGSSWELRASPNANGSRVEMIWVRRFRPGPRGAIFGTLFRLIGRPIFRRYASDTLENLRKLKQPD